jgi:hypothetical protein
MRPIELGFVLCAVAAAVPASAQVYRWVDDRGVVNYASKPPADGRPTLRIDQQESRVSIIPTAPRGPLTPAPSAVALPSAPSGFPGLVDQTTVGALSPELRTRCIAERRVNCDSPTAATFDVVPSIAQSAPPALFGPWVVR